MQFRGQIHFAEEKKEGEREREREEGGEKKQKNRKCILDKNATPSLFGRFSSE